MTEQPRDQDWIYALDIGTRSIIGILGREVDGRFQVVAIEQEEHAKRAMRDGQIEDIARVAQVARQVTNRIEKKMGVQLRRVCVAAAGRALQMERAHFTLRLPTPQRIDEELIGQLEAGAVSEAESALAQKGERLERFFLVGYTVSEYQLDHYPLTTLKEHTGQELEAEVVATFLPNQVVESLYAAMREADLEIANLTLEPIAALNAVIPSELRLLNLALVDIGAGTCDIAICRDGSVVGYTMATVAGDEVTEELMRAFLVDFQTAERLKLAMSETESVCFTDVLGIEQSVTPEELLQAVQAITLVLTKEIARRILEINDNHPSALFLSGGGSKLRGLPTVMAETLQMDARRVALAGNHFDQSAFSEEYELNNPEYATPLGIAVSAGLGLINDSYRVKLNGVSAKLFRNGALTVQDVLMMNGYTYADMIGRNGQGLYVTLNEKRIAFHGEPAIPSVLRLNGKVSAVTAMVHAGDQIEFEPAKSGQSICKTVTEVIESDYTGSVLVNGIEMPRDTVLHSGDVLLAARADKPKEKTPVSKTANADSRLCVVLNGAPLELPAKQEEAPYYLMDVLKYSGIDFSHLQHPVILQVNGKDAPFVQVLHQNDTVFIRETTN